MSLRQSGVYLLPHIWLVTSSIMIFIWSSICFLRCIMIYPFCLLGFGIWLYWICVLINLFFNVKQLWDFLWAIWVTVFLWIFWCTLYLFHLALAGLYNCLHKCYDIDIFFVFFLLHMVGFSQGLAYALKDCTWFEFLSGLPL